VVDFCVLAELMFELVRDEVIKEIRLNCCGNYVC